MTRWISLLAFLTLSFLASAETFRLRNGSTVNGTIKRGGNGSVIIETSNGVSSYQLIDFDDATQARLSRYDAPLATPMPAPPQPAATPQPQPTSDADVESEIVEVEPGKTSNFQKSADEFVKRLSAAKDLQGPSRLIYLAGMILCAIGGLWGIIRGFQEGVLWGIAIILCGIAWIAFLIVHWQRAKDPFFLQLLGIAAILFAIVVMG